MNDPPRSDPLRKQATLVRLVVVLGMTLLVPPAVAASAGSLPIELDWEGPPSCAPPEDLDGAVRGFLGDVPPPDDVPPIAARVTLRESADGRFDVRMVTTSGGATRERRLGTETCDEARELVAFLLALLVDPRAAEPAASSAASAPPAPAKPAAEPDRAAPVSAPENERDAHFVLGLAASAELGVLPGGSFGGEVRGGVVLSRFSLEAVARAWLPRHAESPDVAGAGGKFTAFEAGVLGCLRGAPGGGLSAQACAGPFLLSLEGEGYGVTAPGSERALVAAAAGEAALLVAIARHLSLRPALGVLVPFGRPTFAIHDVGAIHRPAAVAARAALGLEARF
ncbi:MAG TPA: hypothetical protein VFZ53_01670 [Polyangiaceae bacterium]